MRVPTVIVSLLASDFPLNTLTGLGKLTPLHFTGLVITGTLTETSSLYADTLSLYKDTSSLYDGTSLFGGSKNRLYAKTQNTWMPVKF